MSPMNIVTIWKGKVLIHRFAEVFFFFPFFFSSLVHNEPRFVRPLGVEQRANEQGAAGPVRNTPGPACGDSLLIHGKSCVARQNCDASRPGGGDFSPAPQLVVAVVVVERDAE